MTNKTIALHQYDGSVELMKIDLSTGASEIGPSKESSEEKIAFGMFELEEGNQPPQALALLATPDGPLLIFNGTMYRPNACETRAEITEQGEFSHFRILHLGAPVFELSYKEKFGVGLHPFAQDREDIDFYFWLKNKINEPKFYQAYTREIVFME